MNYVKFGVSVPKFIVIFGLILQYYPIVSFNVLVAEEA